MDNKMDKMTLLWLMMVLLFLHVPVSLTSKTSQGHCRDRAGFYDADTFRLVTCASCYGYLFPQKSDMRSFGKWVVSLDEQRGHRRLVPDVHVTGCREEICRSLSRKDCYRWIECCLAAEECCREQLKHNKKFNRGHHIQELNMNGSSEFVDNSNNGNRSYSKQTDDIQDPDDPDERSCPQTWDGYACWTASPTHSHLLQQCPDFLTILPDQRVVARKECTENGTWYTDPESQLEWTDYTACVDIKVFKQELDISITCCVVSLTFLIPAVGIFLSYRSLRCQPRIRLHIHLFASFLLTSFINLLWEVFIVRDRMINPKQESVISRDSACCKLLYVMTRYARSTNFFWMFCEGFFLHRLVANAFKPPTSIAVFAAFGWGAPVVPVLVYSIIKHFKNIKSCWLTNIGVYEWIIYLPNLISLLANFVFLLNILRILLTQVQVHPNEPRSYRRALKATGMLVPLFGIQLFFIIYRPPFGSPGWKQYEIFSSFITQSQGFAVALILCYVNKEVFGLVKGTIAGYRLTGPKPHARMNETRGTDTHDSDHEYHGNKTHPKVYVTQC